MDKEFSTLSDLILKGDLSGIRKALESGADPNCCLGDGYSVLHAAASMDEPRIIRLLIARGGNPSAKDAKGESPLHVASREGARRAVSTLISLGCNMDARNVEGLTALHIARNEKNETIAGMLANKSGMAAGVWA